MVRLYETGAIKQEEDSSSTFKGTENSYLRSWVVKSSDDVRHKRPERNWVIIGDVVCLQV